MKRFQESGRRAVFIAKQKKNVVVGVFLLISLGVVFFSARSIDTESIVEDLLRPWMISAAKHLSEKGGGRRLPRSPFLCPMANRNLSCQPSPKPIHSAHRGSPSSCPEYFRWIHEDLGPWKESGITKKMVERAGRTANFRLVVLNGRLYIESYLPPFQTRDIFGWWGFIQLLRKYPGRIPDLDLMFDCDDSPIIRASDYVGEIPPPVFSYCKDASTFNIPFPDWSFWGWEEINIKPWVKLRDEIKEGNQRMKWEAREPYAFWKGNPTVCGERGDLVRCNVTQENDWNARLFSQDWGIEANQGFLHSNLADQCTYRYKIYIEGWSWSVSQKYILACDSLTLRITPNYEEFFTRALMPLKHYWPVKRESKCSSIKSAVEWGNTNKEQAQAMGREASNFILEDLKMDNVYDYMFHLLNEYSKLLRYKPRIPPNAVEVCVDSMLCYAAEGRERTFMVESKVDIDEASVPCSLPPPFTLEEMASISKKKEEAMKIVESWEQKST